MIFISIQINTKIISDFLNSLLSTFNELNTFDKILGIIIDSVEEQTIEKNSKLNISPFFAVKKSFINSIISSYILLYVNIKKT
jgi:hypothetical protein